MHTDFYKEYQNLIYAEDKFIVKIKAGSKTTEIKDVVEILGNYPVLKALYIHIKEPAVDGKANKSLLKFLKKKFGLNLLINSGQTSKLKVLKIVKK